MPQGLVANLTKGCLESLNGADLQAVIAADGYVRDNLVPGGAAKFIMEPAVYKERKA